MDELIFISNDLLDPVIRKRLKLPLYFISFAIADGKMYKGYKGNSTMVIHNEVTRNRYNVVVYGAVFLCKNFDLFSKALDGHHVCSKSIVGFNLKQDINCRENATVTLIEFDTLDELARLQYQEKAKVEVQMYYANTKNPKILRRVTDGLNQYRIKDGINVKEFTGLFTEVKHAKREPKV